MSENLDIVAAVFNAAEDNNLLQDDTTEYSVVMNELSDLIREDLFDALEMAVNLRVRAAQIEGFRLGWNLRGKA